MTYDTMNIAMEIRFLSCKNCFITRKQIHELAAIIEILIGEMHTMFFGLAVPPLAILYWTIFALFSFYFYFKFKCKIILNNLNFKKIIIIIIITCPLAIVLAWKVIAMYIKHSASFQQPQF